MAVEYLGFLPLLLLIGLVGVQLGIAAYAAQQAGTAARAAARAAGVDDEDAVPDPRAAGRAAMSDWIADHSTISSSGRGSWTVSVEVPSVIPFLDPPRVTKTATMPVPASGSDVVPDFAPEEDQP
ncbi:TadE/TadG family type IV pilus assembly protein [Streptomyces sp. NPDC053493]|uniref:TadE/TadG family type IV pilus assembly protein n=1 Tax=Streptomyces sp. NPDC053493 TaxID=3365705 RepID=UPI0037D7CC90